MKITVLSLLFDGDEMNMHMPQNVLSETELRHLAAIPYQIISPADNSRYNHFFKEASKIKSKRRYSKDKKAS